MMVGEVLASFQFGKNVAARDDDIVLFCFPFAGSFKDEFTAYRNVLRDSVKVASLVMPVTTDTSINDPTELTDYLVHTLSPPPTNYIVWGHSAGALMATRFALDAVRYGCPPPKKLIISSCPHPNEYRAIRNRNLWQSSDEELIEFMRRMGRTPESLFAHPELRDLSLKVLRRDLKFFSQQSFSAEEKLETCIIEVWGRHEERDFDKSEWRSMSSASYTHRVVEGEHFHPFVSTKDMTSILKNVIY